ncbi:hypothetical protein F383_29238 [Gossypium arboreum]|uniref:Uncharacterized protein n=1 Tax=Gossypium arboreum TaxID=29729 RepID=A0A0B0PG75_GOSAR|nr:hypothetical protein F383_29238 [Gossypium arboreum]
MNVERDTNVMTLGYQDVTTCKTMSGTLALYCD